MAWGAEGWGARPEEVPGSQGPGVPAERMWEALLGMLGWAGKDGLTRSPTAWLDDGRISEEGEDPHLAATARAQERQHS